MHLRQRDAQLKAQMIKDILLATAIAVGLALSLVAWWAN
jgi:hypothetical protein